MLFGKRKPIPLNLALQGGGAHGAFTWGVLDGLLEDGRLGFEGISGSSAGAMNAVMLAQGWMEGGHDGARQALERFWTAIAESLPFENAFPHFSHEHAGPALHMLLHWTHYLSPSQLNPFDLNPLRDILLQQVEFERLQRHGEHKLFIAATNANSGKIRLFRAGEISVDAVLASACLPMLHRTVEIDGEAYWDGGYAANPAVYPLFHECGTRDILLVLLAPLRHKSTPHSAQAIRSRMAELAFNATFLREMRMFAHLRSHLAASLWARLGRFERKLLNTRFHMIEAQEILGEMSSESKLVASLRFFRKLKEQGRAHAQVWLQNHFGQLGRRSTVDLVQLFHE
jgi:NTE family protein